MIFTQTPPPAADQVLGDGGDWMQPLPSWPRTACALLQQETAIVRVLVVAVRGSAPCEAGACLLLTRTRLLGTIGGGALEWQAIQAARALLADEAGAAQRQQRVLGAELAQCCGGRVDLWLERYTQADLGLLGAAATAQERDQPAVLRARLEAGRVQRQIERPSEPVDASIQRLRIEDVGSGCELHERLDSMRPPVWLFGAGHVGQALVRVLAELPLTVCWIDARAELFPQAVAASVRCLAPADLLGALAAAPADAHLLILTHDHALDYALCRAALASGRFATLGLIGSKSKAASFRARLARDGLSAAQRARLVCPVGIDGIASKWPAAIAVAIAAQLLQNLSKPALQAPSPMPVDANAGCSGEHCASCQQEAQVLPRHTTIPLIRS